MTRSNGCISVGVFQIGIQQNMQMRERLQVTYAMYFRYVRNTARLTSTSIKGSAQGTLQLYLHIINESRILYRELHGVLS